MGYYLIEPKIPDLNGRIQKIEYLTHEAVRRFRMENPDCTAETLDLSIDFPEKSVHCKGGETSVIYSFKELGVQN